jgi:Cof subfamily protein (haloacid dehalogenase superfamily)
VGTRVHQQAHCAAPLVPAGADVLTIRLVVSDVDGTLVTSDKTLTQASIDAVHALHDAGVAFAVTSGRPPRGMAMLIEPLAITTPIAGFNGGLIVTPAMEVLEERCIPSELVTGICDQLVRDGLDLWSYQGNDWFVGSTDAPHVAREAATVQFAPVVRADLRSVVDDVAKLVGVSDDHDAVDRATKAMRESHGDAVSATPSQPYYLDVTHPDANKGSVIEYLSKALGIVPEEIATIGDMPNDVLMFATSGMSIAMGNADRGVQRAARRVTGSNDEEGFARAIEEYVLTR